MSGGSGCFGRYGKGAANVLQRDVLVENELAWSALKLVHRDIKTILYGSRTDYERQPAKLPLPAQPAPLPIRTDTLIKKIWKPILNQHVIYQ